MLWPRPWPWATLALAALLAAACGEATKGGGGGASAERPATLENHCYLYYEALCERQIGCNVALVNQETTVEGCIQEAQLGCEPRLVGWSKSVEAGLTSFDADALTTCRDEIGQTDCKSLVADRLPATCRAVFTGQGQAGDECYTDAECAWPNFCAAFGRCPGLCQAPDVLPEVQGCDLLGCPTDQYCDANRCLPRKPEGQGCPNRDDACQEGLYCGKDAGEVELACRPRKAQGEVCFSRAHCQAGLGCAPATEGRACQPALGADERCDDAEVCADGLVCDPATGACAAPLQEQAACARSQDCAPGLYCWQEFTPEPGGLCREQDKVGVGEGQPCNPSTDQCRLGLYCRVETQDAPGVCVLLPGLGEPCVDFSSNLDQACREGECIFVDGEARCALLLGEGEACQSGAQCLSTSCPDGRCAAFREVFCEYPTSSPP